MSLKSVILPLVGLLGALATMWPGAWEEIRLRPRLVIEGMVGLFLTMAGVLTGFELLGPLVGWAYFTVRFTWRYLKQPGKAGASLSSSEFFAVLSIGLAGLLILSSEVVYVRDVYNNRFNVVLKFYQEAWLLYSLTAAYATWQVLNWPKMSPVLKPANSSGQKRLVESEKPSVLSTRNGLSGLGRFGLNFFHSGTLRRQFVKEPDRTGGWAAYSFSEESRPHNHPLITGKQPGLILPATVERESAKSKVWFLRWVWIGGLAFLLTVALAVPVLYSRQVTNNFATRYGLNSETWYAKTLPVEYPAMQFLRDYVRQDPARRGFVLENNGLPYTYAGRVSVYTALPTLVGWPYHELEWRGYLDEDAIWKPWNETQEIYQTTDAAKAESMLKKYNIRYVFVGQLENGSKSLYSDRDAFARYSPEALAKFSKFMNTIYADPVNNIYVYAFE